MTVPELTLENVRKIAKVETFRASDFLTKEEQEEVKFSNLKGKSLPKYDKVDAYIAEIIARFGYDAYIAWKAGDITEETMIRLVEAERAREARNRLQIESIIVASMAGANNPTKSGGLPKSLKNAIKMLKSEQKLAGGK